jgi:hypothetical protein
MLLGKKFTWTGGVAEAIERLLCKHEALNSNPSPTKNYNNNFKNLQRSFWLGKPRDMVSSN